MTSVLSIRLSIRLWLGALVCLRSFGNEFINHAFDQGQTVITKVHVVTNQEKRR
jgi:hypothetical protein